MEAQREALKALTLARKTEMTFASTLAQEYEAQAWVDAAGEHAQAQLDMWYYGGVLMWQYGFDEAMMAPWLDPRFGTPGYVHGSQLTGRGRVKRNTDMMEARYWDMHPDPDHGCELELAEVKRRLTAATKVFRTPVKTLRAQKRAEFVGPAKEANRQAVYDALCAAYDAGCTLYAMTNAYNGKGTTWATNTNPHYVKTLLLRLGRERGA